MTSLTVATGQYQTSKTHNIEPGILESAISALEGMADSFAINAIRDDKVRQQYQRHIREVSEAVRQEVDAGHIGVKEGAEFCHQVRDGIFMEFRKYTSAWGVAKAEKLKLASRGYDFYLNKYAARQFGKEFQHLSEHERAAVYYTVIRQAGAANTSVSTQVRRLRNLSRVVIVVSAIFATYEIVGAKDKIREASRQGSIIAGGMLGYGAAGMAATFVCGPAEPACALVVVLLGAFAGSKAAEYANDIYQDELDVFIHWIRE